MRATFGLLVPKILPQAAIFQRWVQTEGPGPLSDAKKMQIPIRFSSLLTSLARSAKYPPIQKPAHRLGAGFLLRADNCTRGTDSLFAGVLHGKAQPVERVGAKQSVATNIRLNLAVWCSRKAGSARDERPAQRGRGDGIIKGRGLRGKPAGEVSPKPPSLNE